MATHKKFMKLLQKRMRRAVDVKDDTLAVTYYMNARGIIVMVHAKNGELAGVKTFDSLEAFVWALVLKEEKKEEVTA